MRWRTGLLGTMTGGGERRADVFFSTSAMSNSTSVGLKNSTSRMSNCVQRPEKFDIGDVEFDIGDLKVDIGNVEFRHR